METHSLGAAVLAGLAVLAWTRGRGAGWRSSCLAWASHVLFDWLGSDDTPPLGVMALWPFTPEFYFAHAYRVRGHLAAHGAAELLAAQPVRRRHGEC